MQISLVLGLIFTAAFAALFLGSLNLVSVAFSVMYIGIGADYAIYLSLRYRELAARSFSHPSALKRAVRHVGGSLEIGTLTTAIGFFCFIPTSYRGVAELGIISGAGMFISLIVTLAILPAILVIRRPTPFLGPHAGHEKLLGLWQNLLVFPLRHSRAVLVFSAIIAVLAAVQLKSSSFDRNPLNLQDPTAEAVRTFRELLRDNQTSPWSLAAVAKNPEEARAPKAKLEALPVVDKALTLNDPEAMRRFVGQVRQVVPHATGVPVLFLESGNAVIQAFLQAFGYALVAITLVLFLTMEKKIDVFLVLAPLLLASLLTGAAMALTGIHFNFANIIALPLVFGMGVDNCIHMVHRFRTAPPRDGLLLNTSTALAVVLSALTNISGFGNLSISPHLGMASMGVMLSIGILATLICSMIVLPALLEQLEHLSRRFNRRNPDASGDK